MKVKRCREVKSFKLQSRKSSVSLREEKWRRRRTGSPLNMRARARQIISSFPTAYAVEKMRASHLRACTCVDYYGKTITPRKSDKAWRVCTSDIKAEGSRRADVGGGGRMEGLETSPVLNISMGHDDVVFRWTSRDRRNRGRQEERGGGEGEGNRKVEFRSERDGSLRGCKLTVR